MDEGEVSSPPDASKSFNEIMNDTFSLLRQSSENIATINSQQARISSTMEHMSQALSATFGQF